MFKITIAALLVTFTIFSGCDRTQSPAPDAKRSALEIVPAADTSTARVMFSGLMVFHKEKDKPGYEVGIVGPNVATDHKFTIDRDGVPLQNLPTGLSWTLEITNSPPVAAIPPVAVGHNGRRPDDENGQHDFNWIIDLEGREFHDAKLDLKKGLLKPIIHLPNGLLYTEYKSLDLKRLQGSGGSSDFGFVPETITLDLKLQPGQELVLRDDQGGAGAEIFRLPYKANSPPYKVDIRNVRHPLSEDSDFRLYYQLFNGVPAQSQYDFEANKSPTKLEPYNPIPVLMRSCCMMLCTEILLGQREDPLW